MAGDLSGPGKKHRHRRALRAERSRTRVPRGRVRLGTFAHSPVFVCLVVPKCAQRTRKKGSAPRSTASRTNGARARAHAAAARCFCARAAHAPRRTSIRHRCASRGERSVARPSADSNEGAAPLISTVNKSSYSPGNSASSPAHPSLLPLSAPSRSIRASMEPKAASPPETEPEPEVFAASASEKAIMAGRSDSDVPHLADLSEEPLNATHKEPEQHQQRVERNDHEEAPQSSAVADPDASKGEREIAPAAPHDSHPSSERALTKEELIEEALNCPCIASMKEGSCGDSFIEAYKCFLQSETEPKGMDCMENFKTMQSCLAEHPDEYNLDDDDAEDPFSISKEKHEPDAPQVKSESPSA